MSNPAMLLPPGFRFHPTDEELILHYLTKRAASMPCPVSIIAAVDIYKFDPWDLPAKAMFGDREWYFFSPRDRKYPNGARPNRAAASGYWKATGTDKPIVTSKGDENIGLKKSLVFYVGKPPKGVKTDWIMHEYRLAAEAHNNKNYKYKPLKLTDSSSMRLDDWVLCRIYKRSNHQTSVDTEKDSAVEDVFIPIPPSTTQHNSTFNLPKSCSLSELLNAADFAELSRLLEHPSDTPDLENNSIGCPMLHQEFNGDIRYSNDNGCLVQHPSRAESPAWMTENSVKREWTANGCFQDGSEVLPTAKRSRIASNLANKFNFISQPFFNQQLISNSRLG